MNTFQWFLETVCVCMTEQSVPKLQSCKSARRDFCFFPDWPRHTVMLFIFLSCFIPDGTTFPCLLYPISNFILLYNGLSFYNAFYALKNIWNGLLSIVFSGFLFLHYKASWRQCLCLKWYASKMKLNWTEICPITHSLLLWACQTIKSIN